MKTHIVWLVLLLSPVAAAQWYDDYDYEVDDMAATRVWTSATAASWDDPDNWSGDATVVSIRNATYEWIASGDSYYVRLVAGAADPSLVDPDSVEEDDVDMTEGTLGSLTAGQWAYGDDDTLGYSTVYVRLSDSADPDGKAEDFVEWERIRPYTGDTAVFDGTAVGSVTSGLDQGTFNLAAIYTYHGYSGDIGTSSTSLEISADFVYHNGVGTLYYDHSTGGAAQTDLMVIDSDNQEDAAVLGGKVLELAAVKGHITFDTDFGTGTKYYTVYMGYRTNPSGDVYIVDNSTVGANYIWQNAGVYEVNGRSAFIVRMHGGTHYASPSTTAAVGYTQTGGRVIHNAGDIGALVLNGGTFDMSQDGTAKTITVARILPGAIFKPNASTTITSGGPTGTGSVLP